MSTPTNEKAYVSIPEKTKNGYILYDLETTGSSATDQILQISARAYDKDHKQVGEYSRFAMPQDQYLDAKDKTKWNSDVQSTANKSHQFTVQDIIQNAESQKEGERTEAEVLKGFTNFIEEHKGKVVAGHNISKFDNGMLQARGVTLDAVGSIDTLEHSNTILGGNMPAGERRLEGLFYQMHNIPYQFNKGTKQYTLGEAEQKRVEALHKRFYTGTASNGAAHNAVVDTGMNAEVLEVLQKVEEGNITDPRVRNILSHNKHKPLLTNAAKMVEYVQSQTEIDKETMNFLNGYVSATTQNVDESMQEKVGIIKSGMSNIEQKIQVKDTPITDTKKITKIAGTLEDELKTKKMIGSAKVIAGTIIAGTAVIAGIGAIKSAVSNGQKVNSNEREKKRQSVDTFMNADSSSYSKL